MDKSAAESMTAHNELVLWASRLIDLAALCAGQAAATFPVVVSAGAKGLLRK